MSHRTLIDVAALRLLKGAVVLDCSFDLAQPDAGQAAFSKAHLPGAQYAHLDHDLSGARTGSNGRHPLPERQVFAATVGRWGIAPTTQVVCYDAQGGPYAARAWWLLKWLGHDDVAVLDGGLQAWQAAGGGLSDEPAAQAPQVPYPAMPSLAPVMHADTLMGQLGRVLLIDARAGERFRGEVEPLDPVAGHIPGASQRFFKDNLGADGRFLPPSDLRAGFEQIGAVGAGPVVHQCGSGVTACHNLLAAAHAGLGMGMLYPGSWSEWCADPSRPVARG